MPNRSQSTTLRLDQQLTERWIKPNSRVLDLGCGDGSLLAQLVKDHNVTGYGLEIDPENINTAIGKGLNIIEKNLNDGLSCFADNSFDTVIMTQALQAIDKPDVLLKDMLRVGKQAIITFPNFAHWRTRYYLAIKGKMPVSKALPYMWYNTPNIHLCTFKDFEQLCADNNLHIQSRLAINEQQQGTLMMRLMPNLLGEIAIYRLTTLNATITKTPSTYI